MKEMSKLLYINRLGNKFLYTIDAVIYASVLTEKLNSVACPKISLPKIPTT